MFCSFEERMIPIYSHCTGPFKRCVAPWKQRSNFGHARGSILAGRALIFVQNFTRKHRKQSLSRKISESKLKRSQKSVKGTKNRGRKTIDCSNTKLIEVQFYQKCLTLLKLRKEDIHPFFGVSMYVRRNIFSQLWNRKFQVLLIPAKFEGLPFCQVTFFLLLLFMFFFSFRSSIAVITADAVVASCAGHVLNTITLLRDTGGIPCECAVFVMNISSPTGV